MTGVDEEAYERKRNANARLIHCRDVGRALSRRRQYPNRMPPVPLFGVTVTEHTSAACTGRFHDESVEAGSCEQALQLAAGHASRLRAPTGSGKVKRPCS